MGGDPSARDAGKEARSLVEPATPVTCRTAGHQRQTSRGIGSNMAEVPRTAVDAIAVQTSNASAGVGLDGGFVLSCVAPAP